MSTMDLIALISAMLLLAIVPGPDVFAIIARSFSSGFSRGIYMTMGMILADYLFIVLALFGLSALSEIMGTAFIVIKYLSAMYLIWLGYKLLKSSAIKMDIEANAQSSLGSSFMAGLLVTLGNPKAILFYVGFFPAFVNIETVSAYDAGLIMLAATVVFGSVNLGYAFMAVKAKGIFKSPNASNVMNKAAGSIMVSTGVLVAVKA
ncbi:LysE family translocator [Shewanella surugensis]|uniref:LysE family translocator n=1 Tax=Shewanella surugensis TaxID=212020 RepID=A0ABT0LAP3_9GAMM|nr:LysE family translocator [Shewanella surugensis]MCL1124738.1 LysE family translocator [Shewanella surugensis]